MGIKSTDKHWIHDLVHISAQKGLRHVVISPGSRSAPLVIAFHQHPDINCISIIDERAAAFFAMGMAQQLKQPVGLVCTSGSATLNYAPAVAEAFYSKIPLILYTADRPNEWIGQADGQAIRQFDIYRNYVKASYELPSAIQDADMHWYSNRIVSEAMSTCMIPDMGPVHVNVPFREPLYNTKQYNGETPKVIEATPVAHTLPNEVTEELMQAWQKYDNIMIVAGTHAPDATLQQAIDNIAERDNVTILAEITANLRGDYIVNTLDPALEAIPKHDKASYKPDLLITFGGPVVSKKLKRYLREHQPTEHWFVDESGDHTDTFQTLTRVIRLCPADLLQLVKSNTSNKAESTYKAQWQLALSDATTRHNKILQEAPYCDLKVFGSLLKHLPDNGCLHLANSTPVRYVGLFDTNKLEGVSIYCNRGTSGIDGTISTAAGAAYANYKLTTVISGDLSFFYDSNALWNKHLPANLRIVVINNGGGNIFRIIPGPGSLGQEIMETYFETKHTASVEHMAAAFNIPYYLCTNMEELTEKLPEFFQPNTDTAVIMEVQTPNDISARILKEHMNI